MVNKIRYRKHDMQGKNNPISYTTVTMWPSFNRTWM